MARLGFEFEVRWSQPMRLSPGTALKTIARLPLVAAARYGYFDGRRRSTHETQVAARFRIARCVPPISLVAGGIRPYCSGW
jgi:hypothetical protein